MTRDSRIESVELTRVENGEVSIQRDWLAVEEPLEIRLLGDGRESTLLTTMRTPGHDDELAVGLLVAEGVLRDASELLGIDHTNDPRVPLDMRSNTIDVRVSNDTIERAESSRRQFVSSAACGVCGRVVVDDLRRRGIAPFPVEATVSASVIASLPDTLREAQAVFEQTGGLHAMAIFTLEGDLLHLREDIGRHNAADKLFGRAWFDGETPLNDRIALASGRAGFEIIQKCLVAGVRFLACVGAPSSLAVDMALEMNMTLIGFLRGERFNIYSAPERITVELQ